MTKITGHRRLFIAGLSTALTGVFIAGSFQLIGDHRWFWNMAPFIDLLALVCTVVGSLMVGYSISRKQNRRLWLVIIGVVLGLVCIGTGIISSGLAALGMYYLRSAVSHIGWDSYTGAFLFGGSQIRFLQFAVGSGLLGGFLIAFGLARKSVPVVKPLPAQF